MTTQSERIKERRQELKLTQDQLSKQVGVSRVSITQWENDPSVKIAGTNLTKLARALGVTAHYILNGGPMRVEDGRHGRYEVDLNTADSPPMIGMAPEISWVQAGAWTEVCHIERDPDAMTWHPRPAGASELTFVLRVVGESMAPEYLPGTLIFVDPERRAESGKDVIAVMTDTGEATFKRFIEEPGAGKLLKALNPHWHEPYIPINGNCRIVGVVVADMRLR